jgi:hypothetical protein
VPFSKSVAKIVLILFPANIRRKKTAKKSLFFIEKS